MTEEQLMDVLDCGNAQENWQTVIRHWRARGDDARRICEQLRRDATDARERAEEAQEDAANFYALATALERASVTFPPCVSDRSGEAIETTKIGSTEGESAGPKDNAQNMSGPSHE